MLPAMATRFFRAGVGTVIYKQNGDVALFERATPPIGYWQFQQGGIDLGETPEETLWRELKEEVGLDKSAVEHVTEYPTWLSYEDTAATTDADVPRLGQIHRWYFLRLSEDATIDLATAHDDEFSAWKWSTFSEAIARTIDYKASVYETLERYFKEHILN